jgi:hypothetical protein
MRLVIKDAHKGNGNGVTRGATGTTTSDAVMSDETDRPLLATVFRAIDGASVEVEEAVLLHEGASRPRIEFARLARPSSSAVACGTSTKPRGK